MIIEDIELQNIKGGFKYGLIAALGVILTLVAGMVDGYWRPLKCN